MCNSSSVTSSSSSGDRVHLGLCLYLRYMDYEGGLIIYEGPVIRRYDLRSLCYGNDTL